MKKILIGLTLMSSMSAKASLNCKLSVSYVPADGSSYGAPLGEDIKFTHYREYGTAKVRYEFNKAGNDYLVDVEINIDENNDKIEKYVIRDSNGLIFDSYSSIEKGLIFSYRIANDNRVSLICE